ncbi:MAG: patatin family protein [Eubacteriales bacterium]
MKEYTHKMIKGKLPTVMLPEKWGLVLEGGGTRGSYTAGVLDTFLEEGLMFSYIVGISAGAANGLSYVSGQRGRTKEMLCHHIPLRKYMGIGNYVGQKSYINRDYVFREIPEKHLFFDWEVFRKNKAELVSGAFDCEMGEMEWYSKAELDEKLSPIMASTAIPFVSPMVEIKGKKLLDGGILSPIPIEKSIADGNSFHVIVLTRNKEYSKGIVTPGITKIFGEGYRKVADCLAERNHRYSEQVELCEKLEREGRAIILRPQKKLEVGLLDRNVRKIMDLFHEGEEEGKELVKKIKKRYRARV